jgi:hypothetical protein
MFLNMQFRHVLPYSRWTRINEEGAQLTGVPVKDGDSYQWATPSGNVGPTGPIGNTGSATTLNLANGNVFTATLTDNCTFTFTTGVVTGAASFTLVLLNDATSGRSIVWPASVKWPNNVIPVRTTTSNATDIWSFFTPNNGTTWYGNIALYNLT